MTDQTRECADGCASIPSRRYYLGPYEEPLFIVFEYPAAGSSHSWAIRFLTKDSIDDAVLCDPKKTLYKLPPGQIGIVTISPIGPIGYLLKLKQITRPNEKFAPGPFPPEGECADVCPPYSKPCLPDEMPDCATGSLRCVSPKREK